jgi:hypothetical protein
VVSSIRLTMRLCVSATIVAALFYMSVNAAPVDRDRGDVVGAVTRGSSPAHVVMSGHRAYLDPRTGKVTGKRPAGVEALELGELELNMMSRSAQGLLARRSGRGLSVDLRGRFQHMTVVVVGDDGQLDHHCLGGEVWTGGEADNDAAAAGGQGCAAGEKHHGDDRQGCQ